MNLFKKITPIFLISLMLILQSCSGCDNENPTARVTNQGTDDVSIQVKTSGGNTENINNIASGQSSLTTSYAPGEITYTVVLKNGTELVKTVDVNFCEDYVIIVKSDDTIDITSTPRD
ncbi:hypothetical protein [uncultured Tenacibaculum sp.]|uniref:hypothetical protein n=1 Tax=uncultured Tenacibaculum sp. TaxID=174713 RepID=UPI0026306F52|nr:hypothetical protein [uncultured Tenacibaculum sp.]